jgi:hypothetical protein
MVSGDSKFVLTCTHTRVPAHTHTQHTSRNEKKEMTHQMGVGIRKKKVSIFPGVDNQSYG